MLSVWGDPSWRDGQREFFGLDGDIYDSTYRRRVVEPQEPVFHVHDIRTPVLTECGQYSVMAPESCQWWFEGLTYAGVPNEYVLYPRSGHGWFEPALLLDNYKRDLAWFDYWLLDKPYPDSARQASYETWKRARRAAGDSRWR